MSDSKPQEPVHENHEETEDSKAQEGESKLSREELKKIKEEKKKQQKLEKEAKEKAKLEQAKKTTDVQAKIVPIESEEAYGDLEMIQSFTHNKFTFTEIGQLDESQVGKHVRVRARVHTSRAQSNNLIFVTLRKGMSSCQAVAAKSDAVPKEMLKFITQVPKESVVDIEGEITAAKEDIHGCTQKKIEIQVKRFLVISRSEEMPFVMEDACRRLEEGEDEEALQEAPKEGEKSDKLPVVGLTTRLDNRTLDLRVPAHVAIFRIQSMTCQLYREFLAQNGFIEIHSPKILGGSSEGGAEVFRLSYFGQQATLAQSPQLYKQMAILGEFEKVYEIGPVFRAENSNTNRHLCEFTGLDFEMEIKESYLEIVDTIGNLFTYIFKGLNDRCKAELEVINKQYPFKPLEWTEKFASFTFEEACKLLKEHKGLEQSVDEDFSRKNENEFGKIVKEHYKTDFYIVHKYPESARPFYTMPHKDTGFTCSYDVFMRGTEIISGAQRCHDVNLLTERIKSKNIDPASIGYYLDSFKYGAIPHGGVGVGLERVVTLFLDINNVRKSSLFPRDPTRLTP